MIIRLIRLILGMIRKDKEKALWRGYYVQMDNFIDKIIVIASISLLFSLYGTVAIRETSDIHEPSGEPIEATEEATEHYTMSSYYQAYLSEGTFEEEVGDEMNCLFYATVPIGKYYITAYNHKETGSKITASGKTCHEGTITTCAADVWGGYFRFGDVIEVDGRLYVVEDTGSAVKKRHIDIYFASYKEMARYGSNYQTIYKVTFPFGKPDDK